MQPYPDASEVLRPTLDTGEPAADPEPYADEWGMFVSGYAPFYDGQGRQVGRWVSIGVQPPMRSDSRESGGPGISK